MKMEEDPECDYARILNKKLAKREPSAELRRDENKQVEIVSRAACMVCPLHGYLETAAFRTAVAAPHHVGACGARALNAVVVIHIECHALTRRTRSSSFSGRRLHHIPGNAIRTQTTETPDRKNCVKCNRRPKQETGHVQDSPRVGEQH